MEASLPSLSWRGKGSVGLPARCFFSILKLCEVLLSLNYAQILVFQIMSCAMFGERCEMVHEFSVRVLHSSRVILTM